MRRYEMMLGALALVGALVLVTAGDASARGRGPGRRGGKGIGQGHGMFQALNLTAEQQRQMIRLRAAMQEDMIEVRDKLRQRRAEMRALWAADEPDEAAILAKQDEMEPLRRQLRVRGVKFRLAVRELLTPEQKARLQQLISNGGLGFGRGYGRGYGPGDGYGPGYGRGVRGKFGPGGRGRSGR